MFESKTFPFQGNSILFIVGFIFKSCEKNLFFFSFFLNYKLHFIWEKLFIYFSKQNGDFEIFKKVGKRRRCDWFFSNVKSRIRRTLEKNRNLKSQQNIFLSSMEKEEKRFLF